VAYAVIETQRKKITVRNDIVFEGKGEVVEKERVVKS